jgi:hypothetical protein
MKPKFGFLASVAVCPGEPGFRCRPRMMRRVEPDTIFIPPPPPDTIVVGSATEAPTPVVGTPQDLCLSTGQSVPVVITEAGDTLVGIRGVPTRELTPTMVLAGSYGGNAFWYRDGRPLTFEGATFEQSPDAFPVDCSQILRVGVYEGVPIFSVISARRPLDIIFIPVSPGLWHRYERGPGSIPDAEGEAEERLEDWGGAGGQTQTR